MVEVQRVPATTMPLRRFTVLRAADIDEVRACASRLLTPHRLTPVRGTRVLTDLSAVNLGPLSLLYGRSYGDEMQVQFTRQVSYYDINLAAAGRNRLECGGEQVVLGPRTAGIISPRMMARMHFTDGYSQLHVRLERYALERHLERMLGRHVAGPIRFRVGMDLTAPALAAWAQVVQLFVRDLDEPSGLGAKGAGASPWSDFLMTGLLLAQPHDYSEQLARRRAVSSHPPSVKRVVDLIDRDPAGDLSMARLTAAAGGGARSLQRNFRAYMGVSPRDYIQRVRLARAHDDLLAGAGATVAEIAFRWGFTHVPRFAGAYRQCYGLPPSATLRAARAGEQE